MLKAFNKILRSMLFRKSICMNNMDLKILKHGAKPNAQYKEYYFHVALYHPLPHKAHQKTSLS